MSRLSSSSLTVITARWQDGRLQWGRLIGGLPIFSGLGGLAASASMMCNTFCLGSKPVEATSLHLEDRKAFFCVFGRVQRKTMGGPFNTSVPPGHCCLPYSRCGIGSRHIFVLPTACASSVIAFDTRCAFAYWQWRRKIRDAGSGEEFATYRRPKTCTQTDVRPTRAARRGISARNHNSSTRAMRGGCHV